MVALIFTITSGKLSAAVAVSRTTSIIRIGRVLVVAVESKIATAELPVVVEPAFCTNEALFPMEVMPTPEIVVVPDTTATLPIRVIDVVRDTATAADNFPEVIVKINATMHQYNNSLGI